VPPQFGLLLLEILPIIFLHQHQCFDFSIGYLICLHEVLDPRVRSEGELFGFFGFFRNLTPSVSILQTLYNHGRPSTQHQEKCHDCDCNAGGFVVVVKQRLLRMRIIKERHFEQAVINLFLWCDLLSIRRAIAVIKEILEVARVNTQFCLHCYFLPILDCSFHMSKHTQTFFDVSSSQH